MKAITVALIFAGGLISLVAYRALEKSEDAAHHKNPFALNQSGYGTVLARLGQTNLDRAWHYGAVASELSKRGGEGEHAGHGHSEDKHEHEHGEEESAGESFAQPALEFFVDLDAERFRRTSRIPLSAEYRKAIALDIEKMLLRAYNMDPTDYGGYDAYFHFLVYHELRGTPEDRQRASQMSEYSIHTVFRDKVNPIPWLTASTATLNQFFIHERKYQLQQGDPKAVLPTDVLKQYQERMRYCMANFFKLREEAIKAGRWQLISEDRRSEANERARLGMKMMEQFKVMIEREEKQGRGDVSEGERKS